MGAPCGSPCVADDRDLGRMSIAELMEVSVVTATRAEEARAEAPATVIVVDRQEIRDRGYTELSQVLDDLPGMDVVRPYGATLFKNHWRGARRSIGAPYLLLLDGVEQNHLYFNTADVLVAIPLSSVERIEVVYGPASAVYGPNAAMGVVNVITAFDAGDGEPSRPAALLQAGEHDREVADATWGGAAGAFRYQVSVRADNGDLDPGSASLSPYTDPEVYGDRRLWGAFVDDPRLAGVFSSPHRHRGLDVRLGRGAFTLSTQLLKTSSGYGVEYAADRAQNRAVWARVDESAALRWRRSFGSRVLGTTLLRYRSSSVEDDSYFVQAFETSPEEGGERLVEYSLWRSENESWSLHQDLAIDLRPELSLLAGLAVEEKDLQKAYETARGPRIPPEQAALGTYPFPEPGDQTGPPDNRITTTEIGGYLHGRWRLHDRHTAYLGARFDDHSEYGSTTTLRAGWVGRWDPWVVKALYGEGFQEPTPRVLYGGWIGSGSDPDLRPETSETIEASVARVRSDRRHLLSVWRVESEDVIRTTGGIAIDAGGAENLGERTVTGLDYHFEAIANMPGIDRLRAYFFYSHIFEAEEERFGEDGEPLPDGAVGDLADDKVLAGVTAHRGPVTGNLRGRWIGPRETVDTNPVREIGSYTLVDLFLRTEIPRLSALSVGLSVTNLFDEKVVHPGVRDASSGVTPGFFDDSGLWVGSTGFFNSVLPQPGRAVSVVVRWEK